jgi:hypothetical protein
LSESQIQRAVDFNLKPTWKLRMQSWLGEVTEIASMFDITRFDLRTCCNLSFVSSTQTSDAPRKTSPMWRTLFVLWPIYNNSIDGAGKTG